MPQLPGHRMFLRRCLHDLLHHLDSRCFSSFMRADSDTSLSKIHVGPAARQLLKVSMINQSVIQFDIRHSVTFAFFTRDCMDLT